MLQGSYTVTMRILSFLVLVLTSCSEKTMMKQDLFFVTSGEPSRTAASARAASERDRAAVFERARRAWADAAEKMAKEKELEKSIVVKRHPGIEGEVLESRLFKDVYFDFDKYDICPQAASMLKENAALLAEFPNVKIQIEGHCDERGTNEYNLALGERRARSAMDFLVSLGIPKERIFTISYGEERPVDPGHTEDAWMKNRRAHSVILSK